MKHAKWIKLKKNKYSSRFESCELPTESWPYNIWAQNIVFWMFKIESNILLSSILHKADLLLEDEQLEFMYIVQFV